jgi:hypothetical protein
MATLQVTPELRSVTLEALTASTASGQAAAKLRKQLLDAAAANRASNSFNSSSSSNAGGRGSARGRGGWGSSSSRGGGGGRGGRGGGGDPQGGMWQQLVALEAAAAAEVLDGVQVVAATCVGAGEDGFQDRLWVRPRGWVHQQVLVGCWVHVQGCPARNWQRREGWGLAG